MCVTVCVLLQYEKFSSLKFMLLHLMIVLPSHTQTRGARKLATYRIRHGLGVNSVQKPLRSHQSIQPVKFFFPGEERGA